MIDMNLSPVEQTLLFTLRSRAEEHQRPDALFSDPQALIWYQQLAPQRISQESTFYSENFQLANAIRTRLFDQATQAFLQQHPDATIVEFGAGLSTRYYRLAPDQANWFIQDLDQAIELRQKLESPSQKLHFLRGSLADETWFPDLNGVNPEKILFLCEAVLMFLEPAHIEHFFHFLHQNFPESTIIFDVIREFYRLRFNKIMASDEAAMLWGCDEQDLENYGIIPEQIDYLLLAAPERWRSIGLNPEQFQAQQSGYIVKARI